MKSFSLIMLTAIVLGIIGRPGTGVAQESSSPFESEISQATPEAQGEKKAAAPEDPLKKRVEEGKVAVLDLSVLQNFSDQPEPVRKLLKHAAALTEMGLEYKYACATPENGGMDCSGTIYYLLREAGLKNVPRSSLAQYRWVWEKDLFHGVNGQGWETFEMTELRPGALLFWVGTYKTDRNPAVSHIMIYAGYDPDREKHVMVGASEGRRFAGKKRYGVSAFDFDGPGPRKKTGFIGYSPIPGLE